MTDQHETQAHAPVEDSLRLVMDSLARHKLVEELVHKQDMPRHELVESLVHKQNLVDLSKKLDGLHPADVAYILEALPMEDRLLVWDLVKAERDGEILLEVSDAVRESLIDAMDNRELVAAAAGLDTDEIADLAPDLPKDVVQELMKSLDQAKRAQVESSLSYDEESVGALMDYDFVTIRADVTLEVALRYLRFLGELPPHTDKLFVVEREGKLIGTLPLKRMLVHDPEAHVAAVMSEDPVLFHPSDEAADASQAFERYDLVTAPVVDAQNRLVGRLTVDVVLDFIRAESEQDLLQAGGPARGRRPVHHGLEGGQEPLAVAGHQPVHGPVRLPGGGRLRGQHREAGGPGGPDAHRRRHGRQFRQPDPRPWWCAAWRSTSSPGTTPGAWCSRNWASPCSTAWSGAASWAWSPSCSMATRPWPWSCPPPCCSTCWCRPWRASTRPSSSPAWATTRPSAPTCCSPSSPIPWAS
jgi:CBS domain-containing protein